MIRYLPRLSVIQLLLLAGYCALFMGFLRTSWLTPRDRFIRISFSPDSKLLMTNGSDGGIQIWNLEHRWPLPKRLTMEDAGIHQDPHAIGFLSNDSVFVVTNSTDQPLRNTVNLLQWDARRNRSTSNLPVEAASWQCAVALDAHLAVTHAMGKSVLSVWDLQTGTEISTIRPNNEVLTFDISSDGQTVGVVGGPRARPRVDLWDVDSGQKTHLFSAYNIHSLSFSTHDKYVIVCADQAVIFWDLETRAEVARLLIPFAQETLHLSSALAPDEQRFLYSSAVGDIQTWQLETDQTERWGAAAVPPRSQALAISPDGATVATARGTSARGIALHDAATGEVTRVIGKWNMKRSIALFCLSFLAWCYCWSRSLQPSRSAAAPAAEAPASPRARGTTVRTLRRSLLLIVGNLLIVVAVATMLAWESNTHSVTTVVTVTMVLGLGTLLTTRGFRQLRAVD